MIIFKVYEKTAYGETNVSYWLLEEKANTEKQRLIDAEVAYSATSGQANPEVMPDRIDQYYHVDKILVRE